MHASTLTRQELAYELHIVGKGLRDLIVDAGRSFATFLSGWVRSVRILVKTSTAVDEANDLRSIAAGLTGSDPRFARELYAAADRHELTARAG